jgi:D-alanine-D-alanine ligase
MANRIPLRIALLAGGDSPEREVSLDSGFCVAAALEQAGHAVRWIDPGEIDLADVDWRAFDVAFNALHGGAGEDGRVQRLLDSLGVLYTGSGAPASQLAMSKSAAKTRFAAHGVPTPEFETVASDDSIHSVLASADRLKMPLVVKPDGGGSSLGVSVAMNADQVQCAFAEALQFDEHVLLERYIPGREFTVAVLDGEPLPLLEVRGAQGVFSYDQKYTPGPVHYVFDTGLTGGEAQQMLDVAIASAEALGAAGLARVDLRRDEQGAPWVLELNTSPGMTQQSMAPRAAAEAGLEMAMLCDKLVRNCLQPEPTR